MWRWLLGLAVVAGAGIGILLGALNPDPVTLDLVVFEWTASLGAVLALSLGAGLVAGFVFATLLTMFRRRRHRAGTEKNPEAGQSLADG